MRSRRGGRERKRRRGKDRKRKREEEEEQKKSWRGGRERERKRRRGSKQRVVRLVDLSPQSCSSPLLCFVALCTIVQCFTFQHYLRWPLLMICLFLSNCLPAPWLLAHYTVYNINHQMLDRFTTFPFFANASSFHISWTAISSEHISPLLVGHLSNISMISMQTF